MYLWAILCNEFHDFGFAAYAMVVVMGDEEDVIEVMDSFIKIFVGD